MLTAVKHGAVMVEMDLRNPQPELRASTLTS